MDDYVSIIWVHYSQNPARVEGARESLKTLIETIDYPAELIVVDNGGDDAFSKEISENPKITTYIRNRDNIWFGCARNQAARISTGKYLCFIDNDIVFSKPWLKDCVYLLTKTDKMFSTPLEVDRQHRSHVYIRPEMEIDGVMHKVNTFAGSNCWVMKREHWDDIGEFRNDFIAGTHWSRHYSNMGYMVILLDQPRAYHIGLKGTIYVGYHGRKPPEDIKKVLLDGTKVEPCTSLSQSQQ